jgi:hypothetical protein
MRRFELVLAVCLMLAAFAVGLSAQQSPSAAQQPQAQPSQPSPSQSASPSSTQPPSAQPMPKSGDTTVSGSQSTSGQQPPNPSQGAQPSRAGSQGGLPWGWIVIGIVAVVILIALATRGPGGVDRSSERIERERIEKEPPDDIRRVG